MKVSAALQILTTVMSSGGQEEWSQHVQSGDVIARTDLDLGACLGAESLEELSQNLYSDADTQPETAWVESVIDMPSPEELTSSDDHAGIVPTSGDLSDTFSFAQTLTSTGSVDFGSVRSLAALDNATFAPLQDLPESNPTVALDFSQFSAFRSAAVTNTAASTVDLTSLEQLVTMDVDATSQPSWDCSSSGGGGNIPSNVWNVDLAFASSSAEDAWVTATEKPDVKKSLKTRIYSRGSVPSTSHDSDVMGCSTRSLSSSTSSLTQSVSIFAC